MQPGLGFGFAGQACGAEAGLDQRVGIRVPDRVVHAVEDAAQHRLARAQHPVEPAALFGLGDFTGVGGADRGDGVAVQQARFHEGHEAVEFESIEVEQRIGQAQGAAQGRVEHALVGQVVDGEDRGRPALPGRGKLVKVGEGQAGVPVVAVHHVGAPGGVQTGA